MFNQCRNVHTEESVSKLPNKLAASDLVSAKADEGTPDEWVKRHGELVRLTGNFPLNCEAPMMKFNFQPALVSDLCFVRNHGPVGMLAEEDSTITVVNQLGVRRVFTLSEIKAMKPEEVMISLVCAGNRRMELNTIKQTKGFNYATGGWFTGTFTGVPLERILRMCGVEMNPDKQQFVEMMGTETLPQGPYETCVSLSRALDPTNDILVAYLHNGEQMTPDHGYPVRVIVPGNVGGRSVKWVKEIRIIEEESKAFYHIHDNKVLPPYVDATTPELEEFFASPIFTIWDYPVNSFIVTPRHGSVVPLIPPVDEPEPDDTVPLKGVAYSGGGRMINRVEFSLDGGKVWLPCSISYPCGPRHGGQKWWTAAFWEPEVPLEVGELFSVTEIVVRAFDICLNTQPAAPTWNLLGHCNNCLFRVKVHTRTSRDGPAYQFQHPVSQRHSGKIAEDMGWMSTNARAAAAAEGAGEEKKAQPRIHQHLPIIPKDEVKGHCTRDDAWFIIDEVVYDVTEYIKSVAHPGGSASLSPFFGLDCTEAYAAVGHSAAADLELQKCAIGTLGDRAISGKSGIRYGYSYIPQPTLPKVNFIISKKEWLNPAKTLLKLEVESSEDVVHVSETAIGQHFSIFDAEEAVSRPYTPVTIKKVVDKVGVSEIAVLEFIIKVVPNGRVSEHISRKQVGAKLTVSGPSGFLRCGMSEGDHGTISLSGGPPIKAKRLVLLAGGTGITPMLQLLRHLVSKASGDPSQLRHEIVLIYSVHEEDQIVEQAELDMYKTKGFLRSEVLVTKGQTQTHVNLPMIRKFCGRGAEDSMGIVAGPDAFCDRMREILNQLQYGFVVLP